MKFESQEFKVGAARPRTTKATVSGHLKNSDKDIQMEMVFNIPAEQPNNDAAALLLWENLSRIGGLSLKEDAEQYHFYPLSLFSSLTVEFKLVEEAKIVL